MHRRWLSGILICLLLLTALPTGVLAAGAGGKTVAFSSTLSADRDIVADTEQDRITYNGNWSFGLVDNTGALVPAVYLSPREDEYESNVALVETAYNGIVTNGWSAWWWGSLPGSGGLSLDDYTIGFSNLQVIPAWVYTVSESGEYNLYPSMTEFAAPAEGYSYYFGILVNERMVWPVYNGDVSYDDPYDPFLNEDNTWYRITSETTAEELNAALEGVSLTVKTGDRVEFAYRMDGTLDIADGKPDSATARDTRVSMSPKLEAVALSDSEAANVYICITEGSRYIYSSRVTGDSFTLPAYTGSNTFIGYDINGDGFADLNAGDTLTIPSGVQVVEVAALTIGSDSFAESYPVYDTQAGTVNYRGGWTLGRYDVVSGLYEIFGMRNADGIYTVSGSPWGGTGGGFYESSGKLAFSGCTPNGAYVMQIQYTAGYNGEAQVDFSRLTGMRELNGNYTDPNTTGGYQESYIEYNMAIYRNGQKVWPTDSAWWSFRSEEVYSTSNSQADMLAAYRAENVPAIPVKVGDTIEIRIQQGNELCWMAYADPVITYTTMNDTPMVSESSVSIGEDLTLNLYVNLIPAITRQNAKAGLLYWTEAQETYDPATGTALTADSVEGVLTRFRYENLSAKQMADVIYVMPYTYLEGESGSEIYGPVAECSIRGYAEAAMGMSDDLDDMLIALLNYGALAQGYFDYNRTDLANSNLTDDQKYTDYSEYETVYGQSDTGTNGANIHSVSLILDRKIGMKFMIAAQDGVSSYTLQVSKDADFSEYESIAMEATASGTEYKAIYYLDNADIETTYYIRVATGDNAYGNVLTYSVESYVCRMAMGNISDSLYYLLQALAVLGTLA